jgi:heptosyltransferase-3
MVSRGKKEDVVRTATPDSMKLGAGRFLRFLYWRLRRQPRVAPHMLAVLPGFLWHAVRLSCISRLSAHGRPRVAIALMDAMGDIIAAEPIARLARRRYPGAWICWITRTPFVSLPDSYPDVDRTFGVGCLTEWMLLRNLRLFDVVWDLHHDGRICLKCCIPLDKPGVLQNEHNYYDHGNLLDMHCDSAGLPRLADGPRSTPSSAVIASVGALSLPLRFVAIHCVSSDPRRDWPADKWRQLIAAMRSEDLAIVEVGLRPLVVAEDGDRQRALCGKLSILETAEVIRRAALFIGIDSGPAHLANAVGTQGVILLGAYAGFQSYMPYSGGYASGETATIVRADGPVADLEVAQVLGAVRAALGRRRSGAIDAALVRVGEPPDSRH